MGSSHLWRVHRHRTEGQLKGPFCNGTHANPILVLEWYLVWCACMCVCVWGGGGGGGGGGGILTALPVPMATIHTRMQHNLTSEEGWQVEGRRGNSSLVQGL